MSIDLVERCDRCGKPAVEQIYWWTCRECHEAICDDHIVPDSQDEETGKALCLECRDYEITMGER